MMFFIKLRDRKKNYHPKGYRKSKWSDSDHTLTDKLFTTTPGFKIEIHDEANELYFLNVFSS